jgi:RNA polymerase sigma-70 factor (ECF subfamily)
LHRIEASARDVHRFVSRRVGNPADAADLSQQALLLACSKLETFRGERILAWLYAIAHHLIIDYYRTRNRFHFVPIMPDAGEDVDLALCTPGDTVMVVYEFRQRLTAWRADADGHLHLEHQVAVLLADVYGYRHKDSAAMLHMTLPSFKLLLHEARTRLKVVPKSASAMADAASAIADAEAVRTVPYRVGVACRVARSELQMLRHKLIDGVTQATLSAALMFDALFDLSALEALIDLEIILGSLAGVSLILPSF